MVNGKFFSQVRVPDLKNMILFFMNPKTAYEEQYRMPTRRAQNDIMKQSWIK